MRVTNLNYADALAYLDGLDVSAMKLGLSRMEAACRLLNNPQDRLPMVHVGGTNGKGSVVAMLDAILTAAGLKTGRFISPHLVDVRERVTLNGRWLSEIQFASAVFELRQALAEADLPREDWPTYFEFLNVLAYRVFTQNRVDLALMEVGLGGRLDSTNIVKAPTVSVITGIDYDHQERLGHTLPQIASEKAGIIKPHVPVVLGPAIPEEALSVLLAKAEAVGAPVILSETSGWQSIQQSFCDGQLLKHTKTGQAFRLSLLADYQAENLSTVLAVVSVLREKGWEISNGAVEQGLATVVWPARFQYVPHVNWVVDGCHNPQGFAALQRNLDRYASNDPLVWLISLRENRPLEALQYVIRQFSTQTVGLVGVCGPKPYLYHLPTKVIEPFEGLPGVQTAIAQTPEDGLALARCWQQQHPACLGVAAGSLYTAGQVLQQVGAGACQSDPLPTFG